jgi:hypothetical protein
VEYLSSIFFQPETPIFRQETPVMTLSWRDLSYDEDADAHIKAYFCGRGSLEKYPTKHLRSVLLQLLLKEKVASGKLIIDRINDGVPIIRGRAHVSEDIVHPEDTATHTATLTQSATSDLTQSQSQMHSQSQLQPHAQATPTQLAMENARLARVALAKATRIAQERTQEEAQEANGIKQDATADSRKAKKEERYRATMEKLGKLPPCPKLCRGEECSGTPCDEEGQGFSYEHMGDLVVCQDTAHLSMATTDGCLLFHAWPPRKRTPKPPAKTLQQPAKNMGGGTSGARQPPKNNGNSRAGKPRQAGKGTQQQQQQRDTDHRRFVIEKLNLELEVARTNAGARTNRTSYAIVVWGAFTSPPPPLPPQPLPPPPPRPLPRQPAPEDDLERRQAVDRLFTLYESQHVQMMEIQALLRK